MATSARPTASKQRRKSDFDPSGAATHHYSARDPRTRGKVIQTTRLKVGVTYEDLLREAQQNCKTSKPSWFLLESFLLAEIEAQETLPSLLKRYRKFFADPTKAQDARRRILLRQLFNFPYDEDDGRTIAVEKLTPEICFRFEPGDRVKGILPNNIASGNISYFREGLDISCSYYVLQIPMEISRKKAEQFLIAWANTTLPSKTHSKKADYRTLLVHALNCTACRENKLRRLDSDLSVIKAVLAAKPDKSSPAAARDYISRMSRKFTRLLEAYLDGENQRDGIVR